MANDQLPEENIPVAEVESFMKAAPSSATGGGSGSESPKAGEDSFTPTQTFVWRYSLWDLVDEFFWAIIFLLVWIQLWFKIPQTGPYAAASCVLTILFGIGIMYFTIFLYTPLKIFRRHKKNAKDPNENSFFYDLVSFVIFLSAVLILVSRLISGLISGGEVPTETQEPAPVVTEADESAASVEVPNVKPESAEPKEKAVEPAAEEPAMEEPTAEESNAEPVAEESNAEPVAEESNAEPAAEESNAEPAAEESNAEPAAEESNAEPATEESNVEPAAESVSLSTTEDAAEAPVETDSAAPVKTFLQHVVDSYHKVLVCVFGLFIFIYVGGLLVEVFFSRICTSYTLSPVSFIMKTGFFITKERHIAVWDIAQVNIGRNLWQRILGLGTLELHVRSHGMDLTSEGVAEATGSDRILILKGLRAPEKVLETINNYRLFVRRRMGRSIMSTITKPNTKGAENE